ncbi:hypothetical protein BKA66DRAFT_449246 [Pyrenochaeta sp. MPI-SDFR-AT-0127]|nr:hypothetical protein BKA66DRAFT_449246 [Pyrenochaeta sp. MPI-SDFR-AT-0127]
MKHSVKYDVIVRVRAFLQKRTGELLGLDQPHGLTKTLDIKENGIRASHQLPSEVRMIYLC